ncbi:PREDICTED: glycerophosphodiester phosphodiesterase GDPD3 [Tarenaya hassleriana]|uniref:glycerophosphodiester phosphodiesterase GDPD3 n=1 Tax=Tarenaya hassleriana TaxID=28532 RepID=UPI00053C8891|nr:PREDICTED: glycerophosphodiester phosphodiesterase GDPD3 [Tarenaya hassleriana]XP_010540417.1 PREDICTED: glycerophosphodiester phosphodiesterase GDPD3 [Tarenaya hassleriana]XP_010540418.1 PREDICTED: glycerophosphodiester phosphodiesterase GDPD3 [Tarenaya hassleriana]
MVLKAVHVSDVPNLDQVHVNTTLSASSARFSIDDKGQAFSFPEFVVMGHRGFGMNMLQSPDKRMKSIKENSILSFNAAADFPIDFIEFDVQVTRDGCPVIFHDIFMFTQEQGEIVQKRVTELSLDEFLSYGPQKDTGNIEKPMLRKTKDGRMFEWKVEKDDPLCTLQDAFDKVKSSLGFNIELKFDDNIVYREEDLVSTLAIISKVVHEHAKNRPIIFSSFHPDAAQLIRKIQRSYPVLFITNGGSELYNDARRNSLEEAVKVCLDGGLQGIVSEVKAILRNPSSVTRIKESDLSLISYGQLNNVGEVVWLQRLMGVEGVIVDLVEEISEAVADIGDRNEGEEKKKVKFSKDELSFLLKLIPKLLQQ